MLLERRWIAVGWFVALSIALTLSVLNAYWGDLNQDEGWYLYAAREVSRGRLPYRDFAFTQGPVLPVVYSTVAPFVSRWGMLAGRAATGFLGWMGALATAGLAACLLPRGARAAGALLAFVFVACNVYQSYFTTAVKTYALTALFLSVAFLLLTQVSRRHGAWAASGAGVLLALAAGTRLSAGAALPVVGLWLLINRRTLGDSRWFAFGLGGLVGLGAWALPFVVMAPEGFRFAMFEYHTARSAGSLVSALAYKAGFVSRMVQAYFVAALVMLSLITAAVLRIGPRPSLANEGLPPRFAAMLWTCVAAVTLTHLSAPFPYEDYQVFIFPLAAAALSANVTSQLAAMQAFGPGSANKRTLAALIILVLGNVAAAFSSPINQSWFVRERDRIWWPLKEQSPIHQLAEVAVGISEFAWLDPLLLTQDAYLAVEADMDVPRGMEMGPFSYFPEMPRERAERLKVLNREMLRDLLASCSARVAAFSGYGLAIRCPEVMPLSNAEQQELRELLEQRYQLICEVPHFGQAHTPLRIYLKRRDLMHSAAHADLTPGRESAE